jgi:hypothetical protein
MRRQLRRQEGEDRVLRTLLTTPALSLESIADETCYARCTVHRIISGLVHQRRLIKIPGRGRQPNYYILCAEPTRPRSQQYRLI